MKNVPATIEIGAPSLIINNTLTVDKREMIDLMILEKEEMLLAEKLKLEEEIVAIRTEFDSKVKETVEKSLRLKVDQVKDQIQSIISSATLKEEVEKVEIEEIYTSNGITLHYHKYNQNSDNLTIKIPFLLVKKDREKTNSFYIELDKKRVSLVKKINSIEEEIGDLPKKAKQLRSKALKKALENSEEGKQILSYFRQLREQK